MQNTCPLCDVQELDLSLPEHVLSCHTNSKGTWDDLMGTLLTMDPSFFFSINLLSRHLFVHRKCIYTFFFNSRSFLTLTCMLYLIIFTAYVIDYVTCAFLFDCLYRQCPGGPI